VKPLHALIAITIALIWGLSASVAKIGLKDFPPFFLMFIRFSITSICVIPFLKKINIPFWKLFIITLFWIGYHGLAIVVIHLGLSISTLVILQQLSVPLTALISFLFLNERMSKTQAIGIVIAFIGIMFIFGLPNINDNKEAIATLIVSVFSWVGYNIVNKRFSKDEITKVSNWIFLISVPIFFILSLLTENVSMSYITNASLTSWACIFFLSIVTTLFAFYLWFYLIKQYPVMMVDPIKLIKIIIGILAGVILFNETLSIKMIIGATITLTGVGMIILKKPKNS
jgi:O-acetylserine/cysteine efflux transporter